MRHRKWLFEGLLYEASEREYWAEDDERWGKHSTSWLGFWLLAVGGRLWRRQEYLRGYLVGWWQTRKCRHCRG